MAKQDPNEPRKEPAPTGDDGLDPLKSARLEAMAAKRWGIPDALKVKTVEKLSTIISGKNSSRALKAIRLLKDLEGQNQADELAALKQTNGRSEADINAEIQAELERRAELAQVDDCGQAAHAGPTEIAQSDNPDDADDSAAGLPGG